MTTRPVDVLVYSSEADTGEAWFATVFGASDLTAAGDSREACVARIEGLLTDLAAHDPSQLPASDGAGQVKVETVNLSLPASDQGHVFDVDLQIDAAIRDEPTEYRVHVPYLKLSFALDDPDDLEIALGQHLAERYRMDSRLDILWPLGESAERAGRHTYRPVTTERIHIDDSAGDGSASIPSRDTPTLQAVGEPLHHRLDKKDAPGAFGREPEVDTLINTLADARDRSILMVGEPGVGKTAIVQEAVGRIIDAEVPEALAGTEVWQLSGGRLMAGMRYMGQWQERLLKLVDEAGQAGAILFVDDLVELLEAAGNDEDAEGVPGLLLPHIESGDIAVIAEARLDQIGRLEQAYPNFTRTLRQIRVEPMSPAETDTVLEHVSYRLGRQQGVRLAESTRQKIIDLVGRFRGLGALPGPAVDLAERIARTSADEGVDVDGSSRPLLQPSHAIAGFASQTGLPENLLDPDANFDPDTIRREFEEAVLGQPEATEAMTDLMTVIRAGLNAPERPLGSYLFIGPTGVGKTQTALTVADHLFGSEDRLLRFDMSEYQDRWSAARLVGRHRGEAGQLVRRMREQPFQVVLFDELEKAHSSVFDLLLQALGEGRLTDALGQTVSFRNAVIAMTSNLGDSGPSALGFEPTDDVAKRERRRQHYRSEVESFFRPEFVGRIDRVVAFRPLEHSTARALVRRALDDALSRGGLERRDIHVEVADEVVDYLVRVGFDERYGARPLQQAVENHITAALADFLARRSELTGISLRFEMVDGVPELAMG
jgi:ATP-dependent Clp protease ATP-binding subunit ClpC